MQVGAGGAGGGHVAACAALRSWDPVCVLGAAFPGGRERPPHLTAPRCTHPSAPHHTPPHPHAPAQSPSSNTRQSAARALSNLVVNSAGNKLEAVKFGAVHSLVRMLGPGESELCRWVHPLKLLLPQQGC